MATGGTPPGHGMLSGARVISFLSVAAATIALVLLAVQQASVRTEMVQLPVAEARPLPVSGLRTKHSQLTEEDDKDLSTSMPDPAAPLNEIELPSVTTHQVQAHAFNAQEKHLDGEIESIFGPSHAELRQKMIQAQKDMRHMMQRQMQAQQRLVNQAKKKEQQLENVKRLARKYVDTHHVEKTHQTQTLSRIGSKDNEQKEIRALQREVEKMKEQARVRKLRREVENMRKQLLDKEDTEQEDEKAEEDVQTAKEDDKGTAEGKLSEQDESAMEDGGEDKDEEEEDRGEDEEDKETDDTSKDKEGEQQGDDQQKAEKDFKHFQSAVPGRLKVCDALGCHYQKVFPAKTPSAPVTAQEMKDAAFEGSDGGDPWSFLLPWDKAFSSEVHINKKGEIRADHDDPNGKLMPRNKRQNAWYPDGHSNTRDGKLYGRSEAEKRPGITNSVATHLFADNIVHAAPGFNAGLGRHVRAQQYQDYMRNWETERTNDKGAWIG